MSAQSATAAKTATVAAVKAGSEKLSEVIPAAVDAATEVVEAAEKTGVSKKKIVIVAAVTGVSLLGVGGYFAYKKAKARKELAAMEAEVLEQAEKAKAGDNS